jgi:hypothetical protein
MTGSVELLAAEMDGAYGMLRARLEGLDDDEFFWEPVPDPWTVFRHEAGAWTYHYEEPDPVPAPFTTIGWRLVHLALCKVIYHDWAFGARELDFTTIQNPSDVSTSIAMLERGHALLAHDLATLDDAALDRLVLTNWGEPWPAWKIFWTMIHHDAHHGAEIGALRDLRTNLRNGDTG